MRCRHVERLLSDHLEGLLATRTAEAVAAHLAACPSCGRHREALQAGRADLRALASLAPPPGLARRAIEQWETGDALTPPPATRVPGSPKGWERGALGRDLACAIHSAAPPAPLSQPLGEPGTRVAGGGVRAPSGRGNGRHRMPLVVALSTGMPLLAAVLIGQVEFGRKSDVPTTRPTMAAAVRRGAELPLGVGLAAPADAGPAKGMARAKDRRPEGRRHGTALAVPPRDRRPLPRVASQPDADDVPIRVNPRRSAATNPGPRDDLAFLNLAPTTALRRWTRIAPDELAAVAVRLGRSLRQGDDFVTTPLPRLAAAGPSGERQAARAVAAYQRERAVVDPRLFQKVTLALKATELSAVCERLQEETGIALTAGRSVADEKMTLFCREMPLRDVMRQLSRPFGYTWLRSGKEGEYRYELVQDLRSQLLEEELRSRDRNAALLALDQEMAAFRPYLGLSPDEALARAQTAAPAEKKLLKQLAGSGWGAVQLYFRLSPEEQTALRAGQALTFRVPEPLEDGGGAPRIHIGAGMRFGLSADPGQRPLPPELARGVLQSLRDNRILIRGGELRFGSPSQVPEGVPPAAAPGARPLVTLLLDAGERGQLALDGGAGFTIGSGESRGQVSRSDVLALGVGPTVRAPDNAAANAKLARDPVFQRLVVLPGVRRPASGGGTDRTDGTDGTSRAQGPRADRLTPDAAEKVTTAEVLEALHRATGRPIVADFYTRLYRPEEVAVRRQPLFEVLNQLAGVMRLRWGQDGEWLQFRSAGFFQDRLKEVPNRLLRRWAASRREHGALTLEDLIEVAQLADAQLRSSQMAEGARVLFGLREWDLPRNVNMLPHVRFLAELSPSQRQQMLTATGVPFAQMTLAQQQHFIALALGPRADQPGALEQLEGATLSVDYAVPGWFERAAPAPEGAAPVPIPRPAPIRERTREAALQAARRVDPRTNAAQIVPTPLALTIFHMLRDPKSGKPMEVVRRALSARPGETSFATSVRNEVTR